jgi:ABC-type cobalamin/Fe3+-siderophores transport system ATPase subunit
MKRVRVLPIDIRNVLGVSDRSARQTYNDMKVFYKKQKHQIILLDEMCAYLDIKNPETIDEIRKQMN